MAVEQPHSERWTDTHLGHRCREPKVCGRSHLVNVSLSLPLRISNCGTKALHVLGTRFLVQYLNAFETGLSQERETRVLHFVRAQGCLENWKIF